MFGKVVFLIFLNVVLCKDCYWNSHPYEFFSTKTPYATVRGDLRDEKMTGKFFEANNIDVVSIEILCVLVGFLYTCTINGSDNVDWLY